MSLHFFSRRLIPAALISLLLFSCASIGMPGGGPKDEDPPIFLRSLPAQGAVNVDRRRVEIEFNELVNVKDAFTNVVVSPFSRRTPRVSSQGRKVIVQFQDSLVPNTTYTIDFGNSIEDNNESNKLRGFTFRFSTGPVIDSLQISGIVLAAANLEPQQGMLVGVHSNLADSALKKLPFERMARTDDRGRFTIRGLRPGQYRVFALSDANNDACWDNPAEDIAFFDTTVTPYTEMTTARDTIYDLRNSRIDTVVDRVRTRFLPNDVLLTSFNINFKPQYLVKYERPDSTQLRLIFNAPSDSLPTLSVAGAPDLKDWYLTERSQHNDTLTYWLRSPALIASDTLRIATRYMRPDSTQTLVWGIDTLRFLTPRQKIPNKKKKNSTVDSITPPKPILLNCRALSQSTQEIYAPLIFEFNEPVAEFRPSAFRLKMKQDTVWIDKGVLEPELTDSLQQRRFKASFKWDFNTEYEVTADSLFATSIYGHPTGPFNHKFRTRREDEYSSLTLSISGLRDSVPAFVELLNASDSPVAKAIVTDGTAEFPFVAPGTYYARITEDTNGNGLFDTGSYDSLRQPEAVYYYPQKLNLKKNWDVEQSWNILNVALDMQKPDAIKKNKPENSKRKKKETEEENADDDDYFDVNENPFDPNSRNRNNRRGNTGSKRTSGIHHNTSLTN